MNLKQLLVGTMLLSSIMTPIASSQAGDVMEGTDQILSSGLLVAGASVSIAGMQGGAGAALVVSSISLILASGDYFYKDIENDLLELAMGEEVDSALLAEFLENVRNQSEEVEGKTGVNIDDLSDQELAAFLVSPVE
jgi:hypothetical protein